MSTATPSKLSIIFAGDILPATLLDGTTVAVRVRAMPARHLARVLHLADKEAELLDFVCTESATPAGVFEPVEPGWADNLTDASHVELYEAAKRLNFSRAAMWAERQIAAKQFTGELAFKAEEVLAPMMERIVALMNSAGLSPRPSGSPAPAATTKS